MGSAALSALSMGSVLPPFSTVSHDMQVSKGKTRRDQNYWNKSPHGAKTLPTEAFKYEKSLGSVKTGKYDTF